MVSSQQWTYVTVVDMKSPSSVCLTSQVRVLFVISSFEVCSQQYGQCLFVSRGPFCPRLSPTKLFGLISWQRNPVRRSSYYLYWDKINSRDWRLNLILREWSDKLTVLYSTSIIRLDGFCDRKSVFVFFLKISSHQSRNISTKYHKNNENIQNKHIYTQFGHATMLSVQKSPFSQTGKMANLHASRQNNTTYSEFKVQVNDAQNIYQR